mmetsp:Transcript_29622/g.76531  ORF Transcript_29622/g.76531 Transcript_29622/m.76531 type:complete len:86 (+) Transcript_29622:761-1018(+)
MDGPKKGEGVGTVGAGGGDGEGVYGFDHLGRYEECEPKFFTILTGVFFACASVMHSNTAAKMERRGRDAPAAIFTPLSRHRTLAI